MKIILPVGKGERMHPYTNNLPKCLLPVGGKTIIDWIVAETLPLKASETFFITGDKADELGVFLSNRPDWGRVSTAQQSDPQGLGQAISLVLPYIDDNEPLLIILGDTLFSADLLSLVHSTENILYTYKVKEPSRFGVAVTDADGDIERLIEKPQEFISDEALVGIYYIKNVRELKIALEYLIENDIRTRGEIQLTDAFQMMIEKGCKFRTAPVQKWLDCGLPETLIQTNSWLLQNKPELNNIGDLVNRDKMRGVKVFPPCFVGQNVSIENSTIGPNVAIGNNCIIKNAILKDSIVWDDEIVCDTDVENQIIMSEI